MSAASEPKVNVGTKAQVFHGTAKRTAGGLKKGDLMKTKAGRIVSKKAHAAGLVAIKRLRKAGFVAKKGEFTLFKKSSKRVMTPANHKKAHNRVVKAWATRKSKAVKGGFVDERKNSRRNERKGGFANDMMRKSSRKAERKNSRKN